MFSFFRRSISEVSQSYSYAKLRIFAALIIMLFFAHYTRLIH